MLLSPRKPKRARIPLISLIDMTFMLLVFFILMTHFTEFEQIELNTLSPKEFEAEQRKKPDAAQSTPVVVTLSPQGVTMGDILMPYSALKHAIQPYVPAHPVVIETGPAATVQQMVQALDAAKLAGATEITLKGVE